MKHIVGFSGGIDSQACALWVRNHFPKDDVILLNSDAGKNEHPLTTEFVNWYSANLHPVITVSAIIADVWETPGFAETKKGLVGITFFQPIRVGRGKQINRIDEVVEWAKTARGGRQQLFPIMHERPSCESKYGLCE